MLHFGVFDIVAGIYRLHGVAVNELFRSPLHARSLTEFWSRRWNIGFSEMISALVQRPLRRVSASGALYASFLASGLLHELAISVPVRAGYGLPTLYFLIQGALVALEKKTARTPGRLWTLFWLAAPLPLLFHPPFIRGIVLPLVG
jgi:alginate O-acetyltransferase complex protein AlgI